MTDKTRSLALAQALCDATTPLIVDQPTDVVIDAVCAHAFSTVAAACSGPRERARVLHRLARAIDRVAAGEEAA